LSNLSLLKMITHKNIFFFLFLLNSIIGISQNNDTEMELLLKERREYNKTVDSDEGYRIQIFNGLKEGEARAAQSKFYRLFPDILAYLSYDQPDWKVRVGDYKTELDVMKDLDRIRKNYPGAFKLKTKIKNPNPW